jgi:tetratricopeptide (TPR) repeat protein
MLKSNRYHPNIKEIISLNNLAVECHKEDNLQQAYKACMKIYELDPAPDLLKQSINLGLKHMRYHLILGEIYYKNGNYAAAQKILNNLKSLGKHFSDKYIMLAKIHLQNADYSKALQEYEEMTIECPQRFQSILNGLLEIINHDPFIERSYELLHNLYKKRGKEALLIPDFKRKVEEDEHNRQCILGALEHIYYLSGQYPQAISLLIKHQEEYPKDAKASCLLGNIYLKSGKYSDAIIQYNKVIQLDPSRKNNIISSLERLSGNKDLDNTIINYLVNLYIDENKLDKAEEMLDRLLETKPDNVDYQNKMEQVLVKLVKSSFLDNLLDSCISKTEKLIKLRPENTRYKKKLQDIQNLNIHKKIPEYENKLKSSNLNEDEANRICFDLAMLYMNDGTNEERAISLFQKVAKSNSGKKVDALLHIGLSFLAKGYNDAAYDNFNKILTLYVSDKEKLQNLYQIAVACEKKNLHEKAKYYYGKILSMDMQYKDVSKRLDLISTLTKSRASEALMTNMNQKFENIEKIDEGNIWVVYKAVDKLLKRKVIIKVIKENFRYNPEAIDRFIKETQYLSKSQHKSIVRIYDVNIDILLYIVMEYIDGESLRSIQKKKIFSWQEVLKIATDICDAIKCAHKHGVIHRDIRPDNIRLCDDNTVKVLGFGLARITNVPKAQETNQITEAPFYKSPEQIRGIEVEIDERSDIYSLGITLYEMLTGHMPFYEGDIAYRHINEPPKSPSREKPEIPRWLDKIVLKCLAKNPSDRYQEISHLQKELESYSKFYID